MIHEDERKIRPFTGGKRGFGEYDKKPEQEPKVEKELKLLHGVDRADWRAKP